MIIGVFVSQYANTGLLLTVAHADLQNTEFSWIPLTNLYSDFSKDWYLDVGGQIIITMGLVAFMPYIAFFISFSTLHAYRWLDRRKLPPGQATSRITIQNYMNIHSGPHP